MTEQVVAEITAAVGGVQIEAPVIDYLAFHTSDSTINIDQFGHVIELYDFPGHFTTQDLTAAFQARGTSWDIRAVSASMLTANSFQHSLGRGCEPPTPPGRLHLLGPGRGLAHRIVLLLQQHQAPCLRVQLLGQRLAQLSDQGAV